MLNQVQLLSLLFTITIRLFSAAQHSSIVSLLNEGYSQGQIQARIGLGKGTVGRISKEVEGNKETHSGGHPSKLSTCDKHTKSLLESLIMPFKPPNSLILSSLILFHPKLSE